METLIDGPYFEDLRHGQRFEDCPGLTLTDGLAAAHRAIVGGRLPLALDADLSQRVLGPGGALAAPNLAWDVAIGQSTTATHTVVANLFYRGVVFRRAPRIGDTLRTVTEVVGLRQNSRRAGRPATGWPRCGSAPATSTAGRSWTSGDAPCSRCAIATSTPGTPTTCCRRHRPGRGRVGAGRGRLGLGQLPGGGGVKREIPETVCG